MGKSVTVTVIANMTSNYSESLGNIASVQKIYRNQKEYAIRSRESLKNAIMIQSGMYDDLQTEVDGAAQKKVNETLNAANCRALEGGYMNTGNLTYKRNSSFYVTDAISVESFINDARFHNNLYLAENAAKNAGINLQEKGKANEAGLMPYQYEYSKNLKVYSITIDLDMIGKDGNFNTEADNEEKIQRVKLLLNAVENLSLVVKGNLDNAEPIFAVGGLSDRKTHVFENVVKVRNGELDVSDALCQKLEHGYEAGYLANGEFKNEDEIIRKLKPQSVDKFFENLYVQVENYYKM
jgi:CRISPR-associated protein Cst2